MNAQEAQHKARITIARWATRGRRRVVDLVAAVAADYLAVATEAVEAYSRQVEDPRAAHLHYEGCPFQPYAATVDDSEIPEPRPACTCAEAHMAAYWKGQFILERGARRLAANKVRERCGCRNGVRSIVDKHGRLLCYEECFCRLL